MSEHDSTETQIFDVTAYQTVRRAEKGDPAALRAILMVLAEHLGGGPSLPQEYSRYCSECLKNFSEAEVFQNAEDHFGELLTRFAHENFIKDATEPEEINLAVVKYREAVSEGKGPRVPQEGDREFPDVWTDDVTRGRIGRAFCRAFHLSPRQGQRKSCPDYVFTIPKLLYVGESQTRSIEIVRSAVDNPLSPTQIRRWIKREGLQKSKLNPKEIERRSVNLGYKVEGRIDRGQELEEAISAVARLFVQRVARLPNATVFLKPTTVKKAYELTRSEEEKTA